MVGLARAIVTSLVATAKLNGVEPLAWLTDVLGRMVSGKTKAHELEPGFPIWIRPTHPKAVETLAKRWIPTFTRRVRHDSATYSGVRT